ncbi:MAG: FIG146518: Zn-dependent hydrolases, including glyoxylases [uncultured Acidimicrobiales bacterium]|uniref:FIG146518: Zn-dependent hydrolases, including glyoxylases n=1 Tax=uncultured Acidimicrobiales bacterium TaxID=310071 RepID=A0A6J4I7U0_9ACTN|nr:MAG: FIG146518: Zn-dependent hydrolases, including glyoxylases [uncultured Acidimicrobiales bacterium]
MSERLAALTAPVDPRVGGNMPAFGDMPRDTELDQLVSRVLAPNPSHFSLDGTNTYIVGMPGSGSAVVVDPGPDDPEHLARVRAALARRDAECAAVLVTHHHGDHAEAALAWAEAFGCTVAAHRRDVAGPSGRLLDDGDVVAAGGLRVESVFTPGHCSDHLSFRLPNGVLLTGDHVLGRGTTVVGWPEGDMADYVRSLHRVLELGPDALYPGHGPEMAEGDPLSVVRFYLQQREYREAQILAVLHDGPSDADTMVPMIYASYPEPVWPAAVRSTQGALVKMASEGRVVDDGEGRYRLA